MKLFNQDRKNSLSRIPLSQSKKFSVATIDYEKGTLTKNQSFQIEPIKTKRRKTLRIKTGCKTKSTKNSPLDRFRVHNRQRSRHAMNNTISQSTTHKGVQIFVNQNAWIDTTQSIDLNSSIQNTCKVTSPKHL